MTKPDTTADALYSRYVAVAVRVRVIENQLTELQRELKTTAKLEDAIRIVCGVWGCDMASAEVDIQAELTAQASEK